MRKVTCILFRRYVLVLFNHIVVVKRFLFVLPYEYRVEVGRWLELWLMSSIWSCSFVLILIVVLDLRIFLLFTDKPIFLICKNSLTHFVVGLSFNQDYPMFCGTAQPGLIITRGQNYRKYTVRSCFC